MKNKLNTIYKQAERFAEVTKKAIISGNILRAKRFLQIAEQLLENGNSETKIVISNTYVPSISSFMKVKNCTIAHLFPDFLTTTYTRQLSNPLILNKQQCY